MVVLTGCKGNANKLSISGNDQRNENEPQTSSITKVADRIEVFYFHSTKRCYSCRTIGEYINKTMSEYFSEQIKSGQINYQEINVDLPENKDVVQKFEAISSSLYINTIQGEDESIENILEVWQLKGDETQFKNFLKQKINKLLGLA